MRTSRFGMMIGLYLAGCFFQTARAEEDWRTIFQNSKDAIATVFAYDINGEQISLGSGFFINGEGHLITNVHVLRGAYRAKIEISNEEGTPKKKIYNIKSIIAQDVECDLVIVAIDAKFTRDEEIEKLCKNKLDALCEKESAALQNSGQQEALEKHDKEMSGDTPQRRRRMEELIQKEKKLLQSPFLTLAVQLPDVAEKIIVIGAPQGLDHTVSSGLVSALRKLPLYSNRKSLVPTREIQVIQTDAAISPGSSGGPMLNSKGEVIGIATFQFQEGQNLNFAISASEALALKPLPEPIKMGEWDWGGEIDHAEVYSPMNPAELGQDWVMSFTQQKQAGKIWTRRGFVPLESLVEKFKSLVAGGSGRNVLMYSQPALFPEGYYLYEGHLFSAIELSHINPELPTEIVQETPLTSSAQVKAVTNDDYFVIQFDRDLSWGIINSKKLDRGDIQRMGGAITVREHHFARTGKCYFVTLDDQPPHKYEEYTIVSRRNVFPLEMIKIPDTVSEEEYLWFVYCEGLEAELADGMIISSDCTHCEKGFITCPLCQGEGVLQVYNNRVVSKEDPQFGAIRVKARRVKCPLRCNKGKIACPHCVLIERPKYREEVKDQYLKRWEAADKP